MKLERLLLLLLVDVHLIGHYHHKEKGESETQRGCVCTRTLTYVLFYQNAHIIKKKICSKPHD